MPQPRYNGSLLAFLQSESWDFTPTQGYIHRMEFKGASLLEMQALQADYSNAGIACGLTTAHGTSYFSVNDSTQQYTIDNWQIVGNEEHRDGFSHPTILTLVTEDQMSLIRTHLGNDDKPSVAFADAGLASLAGGPVERAYSRNQRGSTEYRRAQYVLRHTTNAPNRSTVNISDVGVDYNYSTAQLLSEVQNGSLWAYPLPTRLVTKVTAISAARGTSHANYEWGWLKSGSTETTAANNRIEITSEYCFEEWNTDEYPLF